MAEARIEDTPAAVPAGWKAVPRSDTFSGVAGPYYFREGDAPGVGFVAEKRHLNLGGIVHGGCLATLADMSLWDICRREIGPFRAVTVTLNTEFLAPGQLGEFIYAEGDALKTGKSLLFSRGVIRSGDRALMSFSGTLKRLDPS
ncbi:MAG: PaaI family thioesterase [Pseudomonadota bacterium]